MVAREPRRHDERTAALTHVSADAGRYIATVVTDRAAYVLRCMDPFHVQRATRALDDCRARVLHRIPGLSRVDRRRLRWALLNPVALTEAQQRVRQVVIDDGNGELALAYQLKE